MAKGKNPPSVVIHIPPAQAGAKGTAWTKYETWAQKQGIDKLTASDIWYWSHHLPNVDVYLFSSVLLAESGAKQLNNGQIVSSGQAVGIGQIAKSWVGQKIPWDKQGRTFTYDSNPETGILNYGVNLRFSATLWGDAVSHYGWQNAYTQGYNPNDPNRGAAWATIQSYYSGSPGAAKGAAPPNSPSQGPANTSPTSQTGTDTTPVFKDLFVAGVNKQGKLVTTADPNKAEQFDGAPLTRSAFLTLRDQLTSHYVSYTGKRPSLKQIDNYVKNGWNAYTLDVLLSKSPNFKKSPIYKQYQTNFSASVQALLPKGQKVPDELLRQAVVNNWSADALAQKLRALPSYLKSNEFSGNVATLMNVYQTIMGNPATGSQEAMTMVRDAALAGWNTDQFSAYLRSHPSYSTGTEYQSKALGLLGALGLITGAQPVLQTGAAAGSSAGPGGTQPNTSGPLPADKRVAGNPNQGYGTLPGLIATLSG